MIQINSIMKSSLYHIFKRVFLDRRRTVALLSLFLLLILATGMHAMHNHGADLRDHHDCPVHKIEMILSSAVILTVFILYSYIKKIQIAIAPESLINVSTICDKNPRAPPLIPGFYL